MREKAARLSQLDRRSRTRRRRRRTTVVTGGLITLVAAIIVVTASSGKDDGTGGAKGTNSARGANSAQDESSAKGSAAPSGGSGSRGTTRLGHDSTARVVAGLSAAESGLLPWQLAQPLSREVAVTGAGPQSVLVLGGLSAGNETTARVQSVQVPAGTSATGSALNTATHDAAGAVVGGRVLLFGGGAVTTVATVQAYPLGSGGADGTASPAVVGQLPQPRSDAAAVTIGGTAYVVGGYDGTRADREVLGTTNGSTFRNVGSLPVPVRYPAVAALGRLIYVFGGERVGGGAAGSAGSAVDDIQRVDTRTGQVSVIGHLPHALYGAAAVTLGGVTYVAGGTTGTTDVATIYAFDARRARALVAGRLIEPVANAAIAAVGDTAWLIGGETGGTPTATVQMLRPNAKFGTAGVAGAGSPYFGEKLLIADRGNNRMLVLDDTGTAIWTYPNPPSMPPPPGPRGFYFPDDTFFIDRGTAIISNQEENETIVQIAYPSGKLLWTYGHPAQPGSAPGYLHEPDDAYLLKNGNVTVADADNCRILVISPAGSVVSQIGTTGSCVHNPPTGIGGPNGDTPLADGNLLISETKGSYISEYTPTGTLVWSTHLAIAYPSDPQQLGPNLYMCADYSNPGGIVEFNRSGQILYTYRALTGINRLNQPSLAEMLPSGVFMANDDYRDRMAAIDPTTQALVWDYGVPDVPGTSAGYLNTPDGFDILNPDGSTPTHPSTG